MTREKEIRIFVHRFNKEIIQMISVSNLKRYCFGDVTEIENYDDAVADKSQTWECHHRQGLKYSTKELIKMDEYYLRPPEELIFLTRAEHMKLHGKLKKGNNICEKYYLKNKDKFDAYQRAFLEKKKYGIAK